VFTAYNGFKSYFSLKSDNEKLAAENAMLRSALKSSYYNSAVQQVKVVDSAYKQRYTYIPAMVVNITTNKINNYITINRGAKAGIKVKMAVMGPEGVVGIVKDVSDNFSSVISLLNKDFHVSARVGGNGDLGVLDWNGLSTDYAQLDNIPKQIKIKVGDRVFTSGSAKFPENTLIGTVSKYSSNTTDNFYAIEVKLSTNFHSLSYVYVVNDLMKNELEKLETESQNDN
jgi:rod shape-determining protein MreC